MYNLHVITCARVKGMRGRFFSFLSFSLSQKNFRREERFAPPPFSLSLFFPFLLLLCHPLSHATETNSVAQGEVLPLSLSSLALPHLLHRACYSSSMREIGEKTEEIREMREDRENYFFLSAHSLTKREHVD